jgi:hypothetical protein
MSFVVLGFVIRDAKVFKLDVNIERDALVSPESGVDCRAFDLSRFQIVWRTVTKKGDLDWHNALTDFINRREQSAFTLKSFGRKLTIIVDGRNQVMDKGIVGTVLISLVDSQASGQFGMGFRNGDSQFLSRDPELPIVDICGDPPGERTDRCKNT